MNAPQDDTNFGIGTLAKEFPHEPSQTDGRDHRLRPLPGLPSRSRQGRRDRPHMADARSPRGVRALHVQSRMGRVRTVVRQVHGAGDADGLRHRGAAGGLLAAVPLLVVLREQEEQDQNREGPQGQDDRIAGVGAYRRRLHARLAQRRARRRAQGRALVRGRGQRGRPRREGRALAAGGWRRARSTAR